MALLPVISFTQDVCPQYPINFKAGEKLTYVVSYNWFVIFTEVGEADFTVENAKIGDRPCLHILALGKTYPSWDWFFKVRDRYETWVEPATLKPYYFKRQVREGGYEIDYKDVFNRQKKYAISRHVVNKSPEKRDTIAISNCTFDVISVLYYARTLDYTKLKPGNKVDFSILLDRKIEHVNFSFKGIENIKVKKIGDVECIKLGVSLVAGTVFKEGDEMYIWISNDKNHIPVYMETPIIVGSVKVKLLSFEGLKYPLKIN
ncbi:MAG: DUF3108 domain-containing protein [Bacteroidales bacterium]|nr:DUF3108 domain-containing protein [Bacteroidales bacterium]